MHELHYYHNWSRMINLFRYSQARQCRNMNNTIGINAENIPEKKSCQNRKMQKYPKCKRKKSQIAKKNIFG